MFATGLLAIASLALSVRPAAGSGPQDRAPTKADAPASYYCLVHPEVRAKGPGICSKCGDPLAPGDPWDQREYILDVRTAPAAPRAGAPVRLHLAVLDPDSRSPVFDFRILQGRRFHAFVISRDLTDFAHLHPEQEADGSWSVAHRLARPGYYRVMASFAPVGGPPQIVARTIVTAGYAGDLVASTPSLKPDRRFVATEGQTRVELVIESAPIVAGRTVRLRYEMTAAGEPATDIEPYDAGFGYAFALSEDSLEFVQVHQLDYIAPDQIDPQGGPATKYDVTFPRPGRYRIWQEFKRHGVVWTTAFTVDAEPAPVAH